MHTPSSGPGPASAKQTFPGEPLKRRHIGQPEYNHVPAEEYEEDEGRGNRNADPDCSAPRQFTHGDAAGCDKYGDVRNHAGVIHQQTDQCGHLGTEFLTEDSDPGNRDQRLNSAAGR